MTKEILLEKTNGITAAIIELENRNNEYEKQMSEIKSRMVSNEALIKCSYQEFENAVTEYGKKIFPYKKNMNIAIKLTDHEGPSKIFKDAEIVNDRKIKKVTYRLNSHNEVICTIHLTDSNKMRSFQGEYYAVDVCPMLEVSESDMYNDKTSRRYDNGNLYVYTINISVER